MKDEPRARGGSQLPKTCLRCLHPSLDHLLSRPLQPQPQIQTLGGLADLGRRFAASRTRAGKDAWHSGLTRTCRNLSDTAEPHRSHVQV